ncbi:MAG: YraN family protein [Alphaproteobacteria bacterium]|nr:YraN family protein [Alphaproteobacteria bacterium]
MIKDNIISTKFLGKFSENLAALFLTMKAYTILNMRYKPPTGEIDIIARKGECLIFIEVKSRIKLDMSYNIIGKKQISRIKNSAMFYLKKNKRYNNYDIRFDLIIISNFFRIQHIKNAW